MTPPRPPPFGTVHSGIEPEDPGKITQPMALPWGHRPEDTPLPGKEQAIARFIAAELQPFIQQQITNALLDFNQRLLKVEEWQRQHDARTALGGADITGTHSIEDLTRRAQEAEARLERKRMREEVNIAASRAVAKANNTWLRRNADKVGAAAVIAFIQGLLVWLARHK